ncbi:MAG: ribosome biogenesis GTP-binding protein YihA/YsxC [Clostridia bacterium]|nr:ribosome biogenesis GTP-binding protein YihA/YsxC [Clostridia bacterium]MDR3643525.1 ribosome biogenesis GTP-binding protein YihA/YsxC [Clostridia bacterium]
MNFINAELIKTAYTPEQIPPQERAEVIFCGRSNVGKSSLINRLLGRKALARVSGEPGKTVSVNYYLCGGVFFVDLPGYGFARVSKEEKDKWAELAEAYFSDGRSIALAMSLVDVRRGPTPDDLQMLEFLSQRGIRSVVVLTKGDKLKKSELEQRLSALPAELSPAGEIPFIVTSAKSGQGIGELRGYIAKCTGA